MNATPSLRHTMNLSLRLLLWGKACQDSLEKLPATH